jgi:hypothetical protein
MAKDKALKIESLYSVLETTSFRHSYQDISFAERYVFSVLPGEGLVVRMDNMPGRAAVRLWLWSRG